MAKTRELRFGVRTEDHYSQYWTVRADATRPDFYLASQRTGRFLHISLHDPSYGIQVKVNDPEGEERKVLPYPDPLVPGVTRLVQLRVPRAAATYDAPSGKEVVWVNAPGDTEVWVSFEVLAEAPGADLRASEWNRGTTPVGRVPRSGGGSIAVVAWPMTGSGGSMTPASPATGSGFTPHSRRAPSEPSYMDRTLTARSGSWSSAWRRRPTRPTDRVAVRPELSLSDRPGKRPSLPARSGRN